MLNLGAEQSWPRETIRHVPPPPLTTSAALKEFEGAEEENVDVPVLLWVIRTSKVLSSTNAQNLICVSAGVKRCLQGPNTHLIIQENIISTTQSNSSG